MLYQTIVVKRKLSWNAKLSIYQSIYIQVLTYLLALGSDWKNKIVDTDSQN